MVHLLRNIYRFWNSEHVSTLQSETEMLVNVGKVDGLIIKNTYGARLNKFIIHTSIICISLKFIV